MRYRTLIFVIISIIALSALTSCGYEELDIPNFVDERHELVNLVFRLAGADYFTSTSTDYQRRLQETFAEFSDHPAVRRIRTVRFQFFHNLEITILFERCEEEGIFVLRENAHLTSLDSRFNKQRFIDELNDFYYVTNFGEFFRENEEYFIERSTEFFRRVYRNFNREWFRQFGLNPDNLFIILAPSKSLVNTAAWLYDGYSIYEMIVYSNLSHWSQRSIWDHYETVIHEFAHAIGNPIARRWFSLGSDFGALVMDSFRRGRINSMYYSPRSVAEEYVTRALTILYFVDNTDRNIQTLFQLERNQGFRNIVEVFDMLMRYLGRYELIQLN